MTFRRLIPSLLAAPLLIGLVLAWQPHRAAQAAPGGQSETGPIFGLPFNIPPGPSTWYVIQFYGNTLSAFTWRYLWYEAGQGLHFGVDFAAKCGT